MLITKISQLYKGIQAQLFGRNSSDGSLIEIKVSPDGRLQTDAELVVGDIDIDVGSVGITGKDGGATKYDVKVDSSGQLKAVVTGVVSDAIRFSAIAPVALSGIAVAGSIDTTGKKRIILQADLMSNPSAKLYFRVAGSSACTKANAEGYITNGGTIQFDLTSEAAIAYLLTDASGTTITGGGNDYIRIVGGA